VNPATAYVGDYSFSLDDLASNAKKRYVMAVQRGKPVLDKELTEIDYRQLDFLRRYFERNIGDGVLDGDRTAAEEATLGVYKTSPGRSWRVEESTVNNVNNFVVKSDTVTASVTPLTIGTGSQILTVEAGLSLDINKADILPSSLPDPIEEPAWYNNRAQRVIIYSAANTANRMEGTITSYDHSTGILHVNVTSIGGSGGPFTDWVVVYGIDKPAILVIKGYALLLFSDVEYDQQNSSGSLEDDDFTNTTIPALAPPGVGTRTDTVYVDMYLAEVSCDVDSEYQDVTLKDPDLDIQTANRFRIVQDILVAVGTTDIPADGLDANGIYHRYYKLAEINRTTSSSILAADIVDKRTYINTLVSLSNGKGELDVYNAVVENDLTVHGTVEIINTVEHNVGKLVVDNNASGIDAATINKSGAGGRALVINKSGTGDSVVINSAGTGRSLVINNSGGGPTDYAAEIDQGNIFLNNSTDLTFSPALSPASYTSLRKHITNQYALHAPTGFVSRSPTQYEILFADDFRTFAVSGPTGSEGPIFYVNNWYFDKSGAGPDTVIIDNIDGLWYFYYDITGTLNASQTIWDDTIHAPVGSIYWDKADGKAISLVDERHGTIMDGQTRLYLDQTRGFRYYSGLDVTFAIGAGSFNADAQVQMVGGTVIDEDMLIGIVNSTTTYPYYQSLGIVTTSSTPLSIGTGSKTLTIGLGLTFSAGQNVIITDDTNKMEGTVTSYNPGTGQLVVNVTVTSGYGGPFSSWQITNGAVIPVFYRNGVGVWCKKTTNLSYPVYDNIGNRISYDNNGTITVATNNWYVPMYIFATNDVKKPIIAITGQSQYQTMDAARQDNFDSLELSHVPYSEMKILYRIIYQTSDSYTNIVEARIVDYLDLREVYKVQPACAVSLDTTHVHGLSTDDNVQQVIEKISGSFYQDLGSYFDGVGVRENQWSVASFGEVWLARDSMRNWHAIAVSSDGRLQTAIVFSGYIYTSIDYGNTWTQMTAAGSRNWAGVAMSANGRIQTALVQSPDGIAPGYVYTSSDYGVTWTLRDSSVRIWTAVAMSSDGKLQTAVDGIGYIYTSTDYGVSWTARNFDAYRYWTAVAMSSDGKIQTAVAGYWGGFFASGDYIYISEDYGVTWTVTGSNLRCWYGIAMSADGKVQTAVVYANATYMWLPPPPDGEVYISTDYGHTWTLKVSGSYFTSAAMSNDGRLQIVSAYGWPYVSIDSGVTWFVRGSLDGWINAAMSSDGKVTSMVASSDSVYYGIAVSYACSSSRGEVDVSEIMGDKKRSLLSVDQMQLSQLEGGAYFGRVGITENQWYLDDIGDVWTTRDASRAWTAVTVSSNGKMQTAVVYGGQIYVSVDYGITWTAKDSSRDWLDVAMSSDGKIQTAVVWNGQIYTSYNYGATWSAKESNRGWVSIAVSSDGRIQSAAVSPGYIYISYNHGETWTASSDSLDWYATAMSSDGKIQTAVVCPAEGTGYIYTSVDYGLTWTQRDSDRRWYDVAMSSDGKIQTAIDNGDFIYVSYDYGATWTTTGPEGPSWLSVAMSSSGQVQVATSSVGGGSNIYISIDYGATWTAKGAGGTLWYDVAMSSDGKVLTAIAWNGSTIICVSYASTNVHGIVNVRSELNVIDGDVNVGQDLDVTRDTQIGRDLDVVGDFDVTGTVSLKDIAISDIPMVNKKSLLSVDQMQLSQLEGGAYFGRTGIKENQWRLNNVGAMWTAKMTDVSRGWLDVAMSSDGRIQTAVGLDGIYVSTDCGVTWVLPSTGSHVCRQVAMSSDGKFQTAISNWDTSIWKSSDYGATWVLQTLAVSANSIAMSSDGRIQLIGSNSRLVLSVDYGITWVQKGYGSVPAALVGVAMSSDGKVQTAVGGASAGHIYTSIDYGNTWTQRDSSRSWIHVAMSADGKRQTAVAGGTYGNDHIYTSTDYGTTWTPNTVSGTADAAVTTTNTKLTDTRLSITANSFISDVVSCNGKTMTVKSNDTNSFTGLSWSGGGNPGNGHAWSLSGRPWSGVTMSNDGKVQIAVIYGGAIYISVDYGVNWAARGVGRNWYGVAMSADGKVQTAVAYSGFIYTSYADSITNGNVVISELSGAGDKRSLLSVDQMQLSQLHGGAYFGRVGIEENQWNLSNFGNVWTPRDSSRAWNAVAMSSDGRIQTAITGDVYVSYDYGVTWVDKYGTGAFVDVAMSNDGKIQTVISGSGYLIVSTDYGMTWPTMVYVDTGYYGIAMSGDGRTQVMVGVGMPICISRDYGVTWVISGSSLQWRQVAISSDGKIQTAICYGDHIYTSYDYGTTWTARDSSRLWADVAMSSDGKIQTAVVFTGYIYVSTDYGATWTATATGVSTPQWYAVAMSSDGMVQTAVMTNTRQIYVSVDYGSTWTVKASNQNWSDVAMSSDGKVQTAVTYSGFIYVSYADSVVMGNVSSVGKINSSLGQVSEYKYVTDEDDNTPTLTADEVYGGIITGTPTTTPKAYTMPSAASLLALIPNAVVGTSIKLTIKNLAAAVNAIAVSGGASITNGGVAGDFTIAASTNATFDIVFTNVTPSSEAAVMYRN